jgi:hypothetical protein
MRLFRDSGIKDNLSHVLNYLSGIHLRCMGTWSYTSSIHNMSNYWDERAASQAAAAFNAWEVLCASEPV